MDLTSLGALPAADQALKDVLGLERHMIELAAHEGRNPRRAGLEAPTISRIARPRWQCVAAAREDKLRPWPLPKSLSR